ncbi:MAG TPA: hypothetical protein PLT26_13725 [Anaerolineaceae bacterium]|jgi:hypothetical protein|nr:hypothetical protein [Anaerolineaceae bacterium]HQH87054.1 hypothetical protein [Anaerolineaceae bacterium]
MPTAKTECTELSVGFGLLGVDPKTISAEQAATLFSNSLSATKLSNYLVEYENQPRLYAQFIDIGRRLRSDYPLFRNLSALTWTGPQQQAATTSASRDLLAANVPISVKNESNVVLNPSPYNIFITIPSGSMPASHAENWYAKTDPQGIQELYAFVQNRSHLALPPTVDEFERTIARDDRDALQDFIKTLKGEAKTEFTRRYRQMCLNVSSASAKLFNSNFEAALASNIRSSVLENIIKQFYRVNAVPYILVGLDKHHPFALRIPDITEWKQKWKIAALTASPDLTRGQSVVDICMTIEERPSKNRQLMRFHVEIRWSHGKFCGNPEGKLYKKFPWSTVPFFENLFS